MGLRRRPYAFTEQGVASHKELAAKLKELEGEVGKHNKLIIEIFEIIKQLTETPPAPPPKPKGPIGFTRHND